MTYNQRARLVIENPYTVGIIGGGQLGKMICQEAKRMSLDIIVLDPDPCCPASRVCSEQIIADFTDEAAIKKLASRSDVITYEIELANSAALAKLKANNYTVNPSPQTLYLIQNKFRQKSFLSKNKIAVPMFHLIESPAHLSELSSKYSYPLMMKACEDSYDGRGNFLLTSRDRIPQALSYFNGKECMLEELLQFKKEISVMVARNSKGQIESFPVAENIHIDNILDTTIVPARISNKVAMIAMKIAKKTIAAFDGAGVFGIEMFVTVNEDVLVNEISPRPHNSGHYSIEACSVSQFEQHLRAVLDFPLSRPELLSPVVMVNILGPEDYVGPYIVTGLEELFSLPGVKIHIYGKKISKPKRKLGHITATAKHLEQALSRAAKARKAIQLEASR